MSKTEKSWSILLLAVVILLLFFWLRKKSAAGTQTQTAVTVGGQTSTFPTRNDNNERLLRQCTYDSGKILTLDPLGAGGNACPPVYTDIAGNTGNLLKDEVIAIPQSGQNQVPVSITTLSPDNV